MCLLGKQSLSSYLIVVYLIPIIYCHLETTVRGPKTPKTKIKPHEKIKIDTIKGMSAVEILDKVSAIFQKELEDLQNPSDCEKTPTLLCGHGHGKI